MEEKRKMSEIPEIPGFPSITPQMVQTTLKVLEAEGMVYYWKGRAYVPTEFGWKMLTELKPVKEEIIAYGSEKIVATDEKKIRITKGEDVDEATIGIKANKSCLELSEELKIALKAARKIKITLNVNGREEVFEACGSPALEMKSSKEIIIRKDDEIEDNVIGIVADKAAKDLSRELVELMKRDGSEIIISIEALP